MKEPETSDQERMLRLIDMATELTREIEGRLDVILRKLAEVGLSVASDK